MKQDDALPVAREGRKDPAQLFWAAYEHFWRVPVSRGKRTRNTAFIALAAYVVASVAGSPRASAQRSSTDTNAVEASEVLLWVRHLAGEVRKLRQEVLELRLESQDVSMPKLERDLLLVQMEQQRLAQEISVHSQEIISVEGQISQPGLPPEEMQDLIARKAELAAEVSERLRIRKNSLTEEETAARQRLERLRQRMGAAIALSRELLADNGQNRNQN